MEQKHIVASGIILVIIIAGMFVFAYLKKNEIKNDTPVTPVTQVSTTTPYSDIKRIDAKHFYINGTHTIVGEIPMPTPCDLLNWSSRVSASNPEQVAVDFAVVNNSETCTQVVTSQRFKVEFKAGANAKIEATFEGRPIDINLIPALPSESPDDFELFIKG
jgi:hypothetical protein